MDLTNEANLRWAKGIGRKCTGRGRMDYEEAESAAMLGLVLAARTWNGTGSFRGYAVRRIRGTIIDCIRQCVGDSRTKKHGLPLLLGTYHELERAAPMGRDDIPPAEHRAHISERLSMLHGPELIFIASMYFKGLTLGDSCKAAGYSRYSWPTLHKRAMKQMKADD